MLLKGMTWDHQRGYDPMIAASKVFTAEYPGLDLIWDKRSLQDFEQYPLADLARQYDLIVIDHPHVGDAIASGAIIPLEDILDAETIAQLRADALPVVWQSYVAGGQTWALPVDAATQVTVWRPSSLATAPADWGDLLALARDSRVLVPLRAPHALMSLFSLMANLGTPFDENGSPDKSVMHEAFAHLATLTAHVPDNCYAMDPIAVHEALATGGQWDCAPLTYGYSYYGLSGERMHRLRFAEAALPSGPGGTTLGGTGLAISRFGQAPDKSVAFAVRYASGDWQRRIVAASGGQPSSLSAHRSQEVDERFNGFWSETALTLAQSYVRPRGKGYVPFQETASNIVALFLRGETSEQVASETLISSYNATLTGSAGRE